MLIDKIGERFARNMGEKDEGKHEFTAERPGPYVSWDVNWEVNDYPQKGEMAKGNFKLLMKAKEYRFSNRKGWKDIASWEYLKWDDQSDFDIEDPVLERAIDHSFYELSMKFVNYFMEKSGQFYAIILHESSYDNKWISDKMGGGFWRLRDFPVGIGNNLMNMTGETNLLATDPRKEKTDNKPEINEV